MAKAFSEEEKETIKDLLLLKGEELFSIYGFKKTSIRDISKEVGIAHGTFYQFFDSKETLFFEILTEKKEKMRKQLIEEILVNQKEPKSALKNFYYSIVKIIDKEPLVKRIMFNKELDFLYSKMPAEVKKREKDISIEMLIPVIEKWQNAGAMKKVKSEIIIGAFRSLVLLALHKEDIGENVYDGVAEFLLDTVCDELGRVDG